MDFTLCLLCSQFTSEIVLLWDKISTSTRDAEILSATSCIVILFYPLDQARYEQLGNNESSER
jgi:hypothetical protein